MKPAIICDLDGTLCDTTWRQHLVTQKPKKWKEFFAGIPNDPPHKHIMDLVKLYYNNGYEILFITGRDESFRKITEEWLEKHVYYISYKLFMRDIDDKRHDYEIKLEIYNTDVKPHYEVSFALEDRTQVVEMYRSIGVPCLQVARGDF